MSAKTIYFVRHGLSEFGVRGLWAGSSDTPLAPEGREQAKQAGIGAKDLGITYIVSSPLSRALETARIIADEIGLPLDKIEQSELVVERDYGELEGTPYESQKADFATVKGIEPLEELFERARQALKLIEALDADTILVVSHGSFGRALRHTINPDIPFHGSGKFENAEIVRLT